MHRSTVFLVAMLLLGVCSAIAQTETNPQVYTDTEAYRVYSVLLPQEESAELTTGTLLIREESELNAEPESCLTKEDKQRFAEAIADYKSINRKSWLLQRRFDVQYAYEIVNAQTIDLLLKQNGWEALEKRYPGSAGYIIFSAVGFNREKTLAVVYSGTDCGTVCGRWAVHLLEKVGDEWHRIPDRCTTVS